MIGDPINNDSSKVKIICQTLADMRDYAQYHVKQSLGRDLPCEHTELDLLVYCIKHALDCAVSLCLSSSDLFGINRYWSEEKSISGVVIKYDNPFQESQEQFEWSVMGGAIEPLKIYLEKIQDIIKLNNSLDDVKNLSEGILAKWPKSPGETCFDIAAASSLNAALAFSLRLHRNEKLGRIVFDKAKLNNKSILPVIDENVIRWAEHLSESIERHIPKQDWPEWQIQQERDRVVSRLLGEYRIMKQSKSSSIPRLNRAEVNPYRFASR